MEEPIGEPLEEALEGLLEGPLEERDMLIKPLALDLGGGACGTRRFVINPELNSDVKGHVLVATPPHEVLAPEELDRIIYHLNLHFHKRKYGLSYSMHVGDAEYYGEVEDYWFERDPRDFLVLAHVEYKTPGRFPRYVYRTAVLAFDQARENVDIQWRQWNEATDSMHHEMFDSEERFVCVLANNYPEKVGGVYMPDMMYFNNDEW